MFLSFFPFCYMRLLSHQALIEWSHNVRGNKHVAKISIPTAVHNWKVIAVTCLPLSCHISDWVSNNTSGGVAVKGGKRQTVEVMGLRKAEIKAHHSRQVFGSIESQSMIPRNGLRLEWYFSGTNIAAYWMIA